MKRIFTAILVFVGLSGFAQTTTSFRIPCSGVSTEASSKQEWNPTLSAAEEPDAAAQENTTAIKDSLAAIYRMGNHHAVSTQRSASGPNPPTLGTNFAGNTYNNSTPCDNEIAIANNGHLISVQNSTVFRRNTVTGTNLGTQSLSTWCTALGNTGSKYDPKVIYDPEADRFILVCLAGYLSNATHIIIGFSKSDTANGQYNLYQIPGNPFNDTLWSDYPMIAVNHNELFVTVNLLHDNQSWQTGFVQSVIWQLNKWDGYAGDTLRTQLHSNINYGNRPVRNLCPVEGGANTYSGSDMFFLSDRNLAASNDSIFMVHITDTANAPAQQTIVSVMTSPTSYFMPPNAREPGSALYSLATNDSRILGAILQNDMIQFVSNTMDTSSGNSAIYYGKIASVSTSPSLSTMIIGDSLLEFGYPNIAYAGYGASTDNTTIISFLHSDSTTFPGCSAIVSDGSGSFSSRLTVKAGLGYYNILGGGERWGDYSGIQRKYDVGGTCWVNG
ncbi:MAG TPA: hypothetical protein VFJ43_09950, partial [Bacteroidia bacterium]|nr:hypothetical protein [Bacteroidia bacterium]